MTRQVLSGLALMAFTIVWAAAPAMGQQLVATKTDPATAARIHKALDSLTILEFIETPLSEVADFLEQKHNISLALNERALDDLGIGTDTPVTISLRGVSLRSALRIMLSRLELDYTIRYGALEITTTEETESQLINRVYRVEDLLQKDEADGIDFDYDSLMDAIQSTVAVEYWDEVGGPASMDGLLGNLVVSQTIHNHRSVEAFLNTYRTGLKAAKEDDELRVASYDLFPSKVAERIRGRLDDKLNVKFVETPMVEVIDFLKDAANIPIVIDVTALDEVGIGTDTPITLSAKESRVRDLLSRMLDPLELTYAIRNETLQITTPEKLDANLAIRFYAIHDMLTGEAEDRAELMDDIIAVITSSIEPETWDEVGGPASVVALKPGLLVVSQTDQTHEDISTLLNTLRKQSVKPAVNARQMITRPYVIFDPATPGKHAGPEIAESLHHRLATMLPEVKWDEEGSNVEAIGSTLIVKHTRTAHRKIRDFLISVGFQTAFPGMMSGSIPVVGEGGGGLGSAKSGGMFDVRPAK